MIKEDQIEILNLKSVAEIKNIHRGVKSIFSLKDRRISEPDKKSTDMFCSEKKKEKNKRTKTIEQRPMRYCQSTNVCTMEFQKKKRTAPYL
jgi:hypothetical protein